MNALTVTRVVISTSYSWKPGDAYDCTVTIKGEHSNLEMKLPNDISNQIIEACAEQIVTGSQMVANGLTTAALANNALEHNPCDD